MLNVLKHYLLNCIKSSPKPISINWPRLLSIHKSVHGSNTSLLRCRCRPTLHHPTRVHHIHGIGKSLGSCLISCSNTALFEIAVLSAAFFGVVLGVFHQQTRRFVWRDRTDKYRRVGQGFVCNWGMRMSMSSPDLSNPYNHWFRISLFKKIS